MWTSPNWTNNLQWLVAVVLFSTNGLSQDELPASSNQGPTVRSPLTGHISTFWFAPAEANSKRFIANPMEMIKGEVLDINDREVIFVLAQDEQLRRLQGDRIIAIDVDWPNDAVASAFALYQKHDFDRFPAEVVKAVREANANSREGQLGPVVPLWQQRWLMALTAESLMAKNRSDVAGKVFLSIAKSPLPSFMIAMIPLAWTSEVPDAATEKEAIQWMEQPDELAQLMGASWLLSGKERSKAQSLLETLTKSRSLPTRSLATAQLWRTMAPGPALSQALPEWQALRDEMLLPLQVGPTIVIADKLDRAGQSMSAVPEWLRIATIHRDRYDASTKAAARAAAVLRQAGRESEATRVEGLISPKR